MESGFTLLEVMIAMAVMALAIVPLLITHGANVGNMSRSKEITHAALTAGARISVIEARGFESLEAELALPPIEEEGTSIPYLTCREKLIEVEAGQMLEATVEVSIKKSKSRPLKLIAYIVNPSFGEEEEEEGEE